MRMQHLFKTVLVIILIGFSIFEPVLAGPGGAIAKTLFETILGKVLLVILTVIFLPLILYMVISKMKAERRTRKDLKYMVKYDPNFDWLNIKNRVLDCFYRIHSAWRKEDVSEASEYMTDWYWQNQQIAFLDRWEREGLVNHCDVRRTKKLTPLFFAHRNDGDPHEGSLLVVSIIANMKDYLAKRGTGKVVEGSKRYKDVETIWSFTMINGKWRVSNIEEDNFWPEYVMQINKRPKIEETLTEKIKG